MKAKVHTLSTEKIFKLIGIASHLSDYKLSWIFNEQLNYKFQQSEDIIAEDKKAETINKFSTYKYEDEGNMLYTLIANRTDLAILIKSLKNIDYFLKIEGEISRPQLSHIIDKIKKLQNILTAFEIELNALKAKELEIL